MITTAAVVVALVLTLFLPIYPDGITPPIAVFLALTGVAGFFALLARAARRELLVLAPWVAALVIGVFVGAIRNDESRQALEDMLPYLLFAAGLVAGRGARSPRVVLVAALWVCVVDSFLSLYLMPAFEAGLRSTYTYVKITAGLPLVGLFLAPFLRNTDPKGRSPSVLGRPLEAAFIVIMALAIVMSVSRGMLLGWVCGLLVAAYVRRPSQVVLGLIAITAMVVAYSSAVADFGGRYLRFDAASTVEGRFREIETAWSTFVEFPLFGAGLGAMFEVDGFYKAFVHNAAAYHLWKFGLVGTALLAGPLFVVGRQVLAAPARVRSYAIGGAVAVVGYLVTCAAYKTYYLVWIYGVVAGAGISWLTTWRLDTTSGDDPESHEPESWESDEDPEG